MDGFRVMKMIDAAKVGDIFITATGDKHVLTSAHFSQMKDGAFLSNSGHFDIEIDVAYLNDAAKKVDRDVTRNIDAYHLSNGRIVYLLGEGRLVNLACAEGHPAQVMDMSFATQAMASEWAAKSPQMTVKVHEVPIEIEEEIAGSKARRDEHQDRHAHRRAAQIPGQLGIRHLARSVFPVPRPLLHGRGRPAATRPVGEGSGRKRNAREAAMRRCIALIRGFNDEARKNRHRTGATR